MRTAHHDCLQDSGNPRASAQSPALQMHWPPEQDVGPDQKLHDETRMQEFRDIEADDPRSFAALSGCTCWKKQDVGPTKHSCCRREVMTAPTHTKKPEPATSLVQLSS